MGDDDIKNAFRLIKNNPAAVSMHGFWGHGLLGFCTGQTFGNNYSPVNFDHAALVRVQWAIWLWKNEAIELIEKADEYMQSIQFDHNPADSSSFAQANADSKNQGVFDSCGNRNPTVYINHVDDVLYAEVEELMPQTVACSVVSVDEAFGGYHKYQNKVLS